MHILRVLPSRLEQRERRGGMEREGKGEANLAARTHLRVTLVEHEAIHAVLLTGLNAVDVVAHAHAHLVRIHHHCPALEEDVLEISS